MLVIVMFSLFVSATVPTVNLSYYKLDGTYLDYYSAYNGTNTNSVFTSGSTGLINNASYFDGDNDYINIGHNNIIGRNATIQFWMKATSAEYTDAYCGYVIARGASTTGCQNAGNINIMYCNLDSQCPLVYNTSLYDNQWHHIVYGANSSHVSLYIDGNFIAKRSCSASYDFNTGDSYKIGVDDFNTGTRAYKGMIDEVAIWRDTYLTASQIEELYNDRDGLQPPFVTNVAPTAPTNIVFTPSTVYVTNDLNCTASGSTDANGDATTYYYKFYDVNDTATIQDWSTDNTFVLTTTQAHDLIRCNAKAFDGENYSSEYNKTIFVNNTVPVVTGGCTFANVPTYNAITEVYEGNQFTVYNTVTPTDADGDSVVSRQGIYDLNTSSYHDTSGLVSGSLGLYAYSTHRGHTYRAHIYATDSYGGISTTNSSYCYINVTKIPYRVIDTSGSLSYDSRYLLIFFEDSGSFSIIYQGTGGNRVDYVKLPFGYSIISYTGNTIFGYGEHDDLCTLVYDGTEVVRYMCEAGEDSDTDGTCESGETCIYYDFTRSYIDIELDLNYLPSCEYLGYINGSIDGNYLTGGSVISSGTSSLSGYLMNNISLNTKLIYLFDEDANVNETKGVPYYNTNYSNFKHGSSTTTCDGFIAGSSNHKIRYQFDNIPTFAYTDGANWEKRYDNPLDQSYSRDAPEEYEPLNGQILLNGLNQSRKYEYGYTANITSNITSPYSYSACLYDLSNNSKELVCSINENFQYNYTSYPRLFDTLQNGLNTSTVRMLDIESDYSDIINLWTDYSVCSDVGTFEFEITGLNLYDLFNYSSCENLLIDMFNDSVIDLSFPGSIGGLYGTLYDGYLSHTSFTNGLRTENVTFSSQGSILRYINYSMHDFDTSTLNLSMNLSGYTLDSEYLYLKDYLYNSTYQYSANTTSPNVILNDWTGTDSNDGWTEDATSGWDYGLTDSGAYMSISSGMTVDTPDTTETETNMITYEAFDLSEFNQVKFRIITSVYEYDTGVDCSVDSKIYLYLIDNLGNRYQIYKTGNPSQGVTLNRDYTYTLQFRDDGKVYSDGTLLTSYYSDRKYYLGVYGYTYASRNFWSCTASSSVGVKVYGINASGITSDYVSNMTYNNNAKFTYTSNPLLTGTSNISRVSLDIDTYNSDKGNVTLYVSNNNGSTYETTTDGVFHAFTSTGKIIRVKMVVNSTSNTSPIIIKDYSVEVQSSNITDVTIDVGNDGIIDYTYNGTITAANSPIKATIESSAITNYLGSDSCAGKLTCNVPILISTGSAGVLNIKHIYGLQDYRTIRINTTLVDDWLDANCNNSDNCTIPINFVRPNNDIYGCNLENINTKYICDSDHDFEVKYYEYPSMVYTQSSYFTIGFRYSPFRVDLPSGIEYYDIMPKTYNSKNVAPYGQKEGTPIFNITSLAKTDPIDVTVRLNQSIDSCMDVWWSAYYNMSGKQDLSVNRTCPYVHSPIPFPCVSTINLTDGLSTSQGFYNLWNFTSCTTNAFKYLEYNLDFDSFCDDCVRYECYYNSDCPIARSCMSLNECIDGDLYTYPEDTHFLCQNYVCLSNIYEYCEDDPVIIEDYPGCVPP